MYIHVRHNLLLKMMGSYSFGYLISTIFNEIPLMNLRIFFNNERNNERNMKDIERFWY